MFLLHGDDEMMDVEGKTWKHMSNMRDPNGITFTIMLRCVKMSAHVDRKGALVHPKVNTPLQKRLDEAEGLFQTDNYKRRRQDLEERIKAFFVRYKP